jgi:hypothetical protein
VTTSPDGYWAVIPDYDAQSRTDNCSVSGLRVREGEIGVFRPLRPYIEHEGYFDISQYAIEQAARLIDWAPPADVEALRKRVAELEETQDRLVRDTWKAATNAVKMAGVRAAQADV